MGGASRLIMLLTASTLSRLSLIRFSRRSISAAVPRRHLSISSFSRPQSLLSIKSSSHQQIRTRFNSVREEESFGGDSMGFSPNPSPSHPWPQWHKLIGTLSAGGYFDRRLTQIVPEDELVAYEELSAEFVHAIGACLAFARQRPDIIGSLSRRDIEVVVENGTPFLFKSALDTARRMKSFLSSTGGNMVESGKAEMVDLMKYLLSYSSRPTLSSESNNLYSRELIESSVRNLLNELAEMSSRVPASGMSAPELFQFSDGSGLTQSSLGQNIKMKRGDWICPKCSFMNFARNVKCLDCEEPRPKRQLNGGEWECPQCDFFNYGRNMVCLRCDCKRPGEASVGVVNSRPGLGYNNGTIPNKADVDSRLAANEEKAQRWFSKVNNSSDLSSAAADEDFPEIMPLRKGENRFVFSRRKTPLERRMADSQYQRSLGNSCTPMDNDSQAGNVSKMQERSISQRLDRILGRTSTFSETGNKSVTSGQNAGMESPPQVPRWGPQYGQSRGSNSNYVPFVPLPPDMFAKSPQNTKMKDSGTVMENCEYVSSKAHDRAGLVSVGSESVTLAEKVQLSEKSGTKEEARDREKEQAEKSENAISDEDFPEIMRMREGANESIVSKGKDHSLTSPIYKRQVAMEQASNTNSVPFVPFPPDYFAKKDKQWPDGLDPTVKSAGQTSSIFVTPGNFPEKPCDDKHAATDVNHLQRLDNQRTSSGNWNSQSSGDCAAPTSGNPTQISFSSQAVGKGSWNSGYSGNENTSQKSNLAVSSFQPCENHSVKSGWTGKSLEGSAVKEPDPLDMSEEAKAARWFRRAAQIKDISELSQIPDEDFPSIMPMRKGVNRFVVSKRKTPLERRLTSPQYRRNLPIISSDPVKKENDNN